MIKEIPPARHSARDRRQAENLLQARKSRLGRMEEEVCCTACNGMHLRATTVQVNTS